MAECFLVVPQMIDMWMKKEYISREMLGIEYLASALIKNDISCDFVNAYARRLSHNDVCKQIIDKQYKIVGVSCPSQRSYPYSKEFIKVLRNTYHYSGYIVMGGFYISLAYQNILNDFNDYDFLMIGEGENVISPFYKTLLEGGDFSHFAGLIYRHDNKWKINEPEFIYDLDSLNFPKRDLKTWEYFRNKERIPFRVMSGRGCYGRCTFCSVLRCEEKYGKRFRSAENIVDEIEELVNLYNAKIINFADDIFFDGSKKSNEHIEQFVKLMKDRNIHVEFDCHLRVTDVKKEQLLKLKEVGLTTVWLGLESGCQRILNEMNKHCTVEQNKNAIKILFECGLTPSITFITLVPTMSFEELKQNYDFLWEIGCYCEDNLYNRLNIYTGCEYETILKNKGLLVPKKQFYDRDNYIFADERVGFYAELINIMKELFIEPRKLLFNLNNIVVDDLEMDDMIERYNKWSKKVWEDFVCFSIENIEKGNFNKEMYEKKMHSLIREIVSKLKACYKDI